MKARHVRWMTPPFYIGGEAPSNPPPLRYQVKNQRVRFNECDPLGIVWHGQFTTYFEDARVAHGRHYGIGYMDFRQHGVVVPLKQLYHEYITPLTFDEEFSTEAILYWSEAARLNYEFIIRKKDGTIAARGWSVQMMLDLKTFDLLLVPPVFYQEFCQRWQQGQVQPFTPSPLAES